MKLTFHVQFNCAASPPRYIGVSMKLTFHVQFNCAASPPRYIGVNMSVRATERLIGDAVIVTALSKSPQMVVKAINEETKIITTSWFSDTNAFQEGTFPASALDRVESKKPVQAKKTAKTKK